MAVQVESLEPRRLLNAPGWGDTITNPYFPLLPGSSYVYTGSDDGDPEIDRVNVTTDTKQILGVTCTVVLDRVYINGELTEKTYDWYAQDQAGNVWYFGEDSREITNGKVTSREGSWQAGVNGATAGIIMQAKPGVGDVYFQESAPNVAEDQAQVLDLHARAVTPFATFNNCLHTNEFSVLEPQAHEQKLYAAGIGEVKEASSGDEVEVLKLRSFTLAPQDFTDVIDNPFMPMLVGSTAVYKGADSDGPLKDVVIVTDQTKTVASGVTTRLVFDRVYSSGKLSEKTYDFFAQDKIGNVWYFGENSQQIENGKTVSREGSWEAGVNGAQPGIVMQVQPGVGDVYHQEDAPGVAEDQAAVIATGTHADVPFATFHNCLETQEFSALEPDVLEDKFYAAGIGLVKSQSVAGETEILKLVSYVP